jgi:hypothetical protein
MSNPALLTIPFALPAEDRDLTDEAIDQALVFTDGDVEKVADGLHLTKTTVERRVGRQHLGRLTNASHQHGMGSPGGAHPLPSDGQEK